jgi:DNA-binding transcriptional LysR family regulator
LDLQHLRAFVAIAHEGNMTRAAVRLHLTQPAVSMQIKALQERLKVSLFVRTSRGLVLSPQGSALMPIAEKILSGIDDLEQVAGSMQRATYGKLGIGTILNPEAIRLGACLQHLMERYPNIQTKLRHGMSGWVISQVRSGELDTTFYLGLRGDDASGEEFISLLLTPVEYFVIAPKGWQARVNGKSWAQVAALPWVWTPPHSAHHRMLSKKFDELGVKPNIAAEVDLEASMLDLVVSGVGLSLARDSVALRASQAHGLVVARRLTMSADLSFIALAKRADDPVVKAAFEAVRETYR